MYKINYLLICLIEKSLLQLYSDSISIEQLANPLLSFTLIRTPLGKVLIGRMVEFYYKIDTILKKLKI